MMNRIFAGVLSLMMLAVPGVSLAAGSELAIGSVSFDDFDACAAVSFDVEVVDITPTDGVIVKFNGSVIFSDDADDGDVLSFADQKIQKDTHGRGTNMIEAIIVDDIDDPDSVVSSESYTFLVDCERPPKIFPEGTPDPRAGEDKDEGDCCPGSDNGSGGSSESSEIAASTTKAKVKGAVISKATNLTPLNSVFRSVYGRTPTFKEWTYWANRMFSDKPELDALFGAMQWHKLHGKTVGK